MMKLMHFQAFRYLRVENECDARVGSDIRQGTWPYLFNLFILLWFCLIYTFSDRLIWFSLCLLVIIYDEGLNFGK